MKLLDQLHIIGGLPPDADVFAGTVNTDVFQVQGEGAGFLVWYAVSAGKGASTMTVEACSDTDATTTSAVEFNYRTSSTFDTWGDWATASTAGITVGGEQNSMWEIYVPAAELASEGYTYVRGHFVESSNSAADGCVLAFVVNPWQQPRQSSLID